jgi:hypothetical protein
MDDTLCQLFFTSPACPAQRQYEALRGVFVDGLSQNDAGSRFGYAAGAFRHLVHQFRQARAGSLPPFSSPNGEAAGHSCLLRHPASPTSPMSPTPAPWA